MKKTLVKILTAVFAAIVIIGSFADETYAKTKYDTCIKNGCNNSRASGSSYCYKHKSSSSTTKKETSCYVTGCTREKQASSSYCDYHYNQKFGNKKAFNSSSKKGNSSKNYYEMPDCDDYEDYDDFMDDWDGCMPNNSDAEDYWENW